MKLTIWSPKIEKKRISVLLRIIVQNYCYYRYLYTKKREKGYIDKKRLGMAVGRVKWVTCPTVSLKAR